jgi:hypothetical protein
MVIRTVAQSSLGETFANMEEYWVPELATSNGGPRGLLGQGFCRACFHPERDMAQNLLSNQKVITGQWGMPNQKAEIVQLILGEQKWALEQNLILPSEVVSQLALQKLPIETLRVRVRILRTHCLVGPDPFGWKTGVPQHKDSLVHLLEVHLNGTVGQTAPENLHSYTIGQLQEMLYHHWDEQVTLALENKDQGRVLRRTNPDPEGGPPATVAVDLRYSTDGHLLLPPNPIYDEDGNMWQEVRMESDRLLAQRLAAEPDPWLGAPPQFSPPPKPQEYHPPTHAKDDPPVITPELVLQAQEILKLAQLQGVQSTYKGQGVTLVPPHVQKLNPADVWSKEPKKMTVDGWAMVYDNLPTARPMQGQSETGSPPKSKSKVVTTNPVSGASSSGLTDPVSLQGSLTTATMTPIPEETK